MDYDDNDYGGHNLHLAGEENSKISSVLQPFSLPKFDFDDSLHGHLRFDSLVENEVFLGIPSQEDNHWIEDFSRGSSGIEFSSNATESCALPRHDNVWSEATSSESVEMLLKAVGQEEVVPGETVVEGSDPQLGSSTKQVEVNLKNDQMDYVLEAEGCSLKVTSENLHTDLKSSMDNQGDSSGFLNESLSKHEQENLPGPVTGVDNNESSSQMITESIMETGDVDKFCNPNFVNTISVANDVSVGVEVRKEEHIMSYELVGGNDSEDISLNMPCHLEIPAKLEYADHAVDVCVTTIGGTSGISGKGESMSTFEGFDDASFVTAGDNDCGPAVSSSGTKIKQLPEGCDMSTEKPSPLQEKEFAAGIGIEDSKRVGDSEDSSFNGVLCMEKTVIEDITNVRELAAIQEENLERGDHLPPAMLTGSIETCRGNDLSVQSDVHECKLDASKCEDDKKLSLDSMILVCDDNEKERRSTFSGEVAEVDMKAASSQSNSSTGDNPVLNSEVSGTTLISGAIGGDLADCDERGTPSFDILNRDQNKAIKFEANKEPVISGTKVSFQVADDFTPAVGSEKSTLSDSAPVKEAKTFDQSAILMEASSDASCDKTSKDLSENMEHSTPGLTVQDDVAEAAPSEKPKEAEGKNTVENSPIVPATINAFDIDESNQLSLPGISCTELSQGKVSKRVSLKNSDSKNVGNVLSLSVDAKTLSKEEGICTSDVRHLGSQIKSTGDSSTDLQSNSSIQASKFPVTGSVSLSTSGGTDTVILKGISHETCLTLDRVPSSGGFKGSTERKSRRGSSKSVKESAKKGNQVKEKSPLRQNERGGKSCGPLSPLLAGQLMTLETVVKPRATVSITGSSLPDLNTSAPLSSFFQQPFTDLQQVQLRAQIFVYGSLIQGVAPDEACMVSSFGVSDGGRSIWEPSWRAVVEKLNSQKSQGFTFETPARSGAKAPDQVNRQTFAGSEVLPSPAGRASNKVISSQAINPLTPLSSPLWNVSVSSCEAVPSSSSARCAGFDYPSVSPLHPYHNPPIRNLVSHTTSWQAQASFPVPWATSSQSSPFDISSNYTVFPISEPVKLAAAVKGSSSVSSGIKHVTLFPAVHTGSTALFPEASPLDFKKVASSTTQTSASTKSRKRKKSSGVDDVLQVSVTATPADSFSIPVIDNQLLKKKASAMEDFSRIPISDSMPTPVANCHYSTSIAFTAPSSSVPKGKSIQFISAAWPSISSDHHKSGDSSMDKRAPVLEEFSKVEEAKLHAEEAAIDAATAVMHCQGLWSQLEQQKNSGLKTEAEAKLASAAVAVAAAASVAKAAAAAAKVASNAAMQAKHIADESVTKYGTLSAPECDTLNSVNNLANAIPVSILKSGDYNNTSSFAISAAKEAAKKRVEAASAATRHAVNLDAIVKAAEMAAEAVSHAGKVVAMGDPFTLSQLVEAGPDGYWKVPQVASMPGSKSNDVNKNKSDNSNVPEMHSKDMQVTSHITPSAQRELSRSIVDTGVTVEEGLVSSIKHGEKNSKAHKNKRVTESDKASGIAAEPFVKSRLKFFTPVMYDSTAIIKEGSIVEVLKDRGDLKKAWFSANILTLKDLDAFVCFTELQSDQGSEQLQEWVSLEAKDGNAPIVRIPHPMTAVQFEGTRKRRRAAVKDYTWSVGDKVDAWVQDCWREGIISEKNKKDTTSWSVHFPAQGETLDVKVWHLRPTVIWVDGQWIEWCRSGQDRSSQGDTPIEKRPKLGSNDMEIKGKGELSKAIDFAEVDKAEHRLPLAAEETAFNVGSTRVGKKPDMGRTMRSGLPKEGSRVVIGVPKPGKKRKFIEVSKHYVSDRSTKTVPDDSVKLAKFLTSQGPGSRGSKNNSKIDFKEKLVAEPKSKAPKSGKPPTIPSRILPRKDGLNPSHSNASDAALSNDDNEPVEKSLTEYGSFSNVPESAMVFSSRARSENRKKTSAVSAMSERLKKGKLAPSSWKSEKNEVDENFVSSVSEPRRSIRRIQPTSRLLEGLQSSLTISKLPSSSHDKSHKCHTKNTSKGYSNRN